jgi:hypothetical protein
LANLQLLSFRFAFGNRQHLEREVDAHDRVLRLADIEKSAWLDIPKPLRELQC